MFLALVQMGNTSAFAIALWTSTSFQMCAKTNGSSFLATCFPYARATGLPLATLRSNLSLMLGWMDPIARCSRMLMVGPVCPVGMSVVLVQGGETGVSSSFHLGVTQMAARCWCPRLRLPW